MTIAQECRAHANVAFAITDTCPTMSNTQTIYLFVEESGDGEHFSSTFAVCGGNNGRMYIEEAAALEEFVRSVGQLIAHAHHRTHLHSGPCTESIQVIVLYRTMVERSYAYGVQRRS